MSFLINPFLGGFNSILFDGVNEWMNMGNDTSLDVDFDTAFTWSFWVYPLAYSGSDMLFRKLDSGATKTMEMVFFSGKIIFNLYNVPGTNRLTKQWTFGTTNAWVMLTITKAASSAASGLKFYANAVEDASPTSTIDTLGSANTVTTVDLSLMADVAAANAFNARLNAFDFWSTELTSGEVTELYNSGCPLDAKTHSQSANLVSWLRMGNGAGDTIDTILDQQGNNDCTTNNLEVEDGIKEEPSPC